METSILIVNSATGKPVFRPINYRNFPETGPMAVFYAMNNS